MNKIKNKLVPNSIEIFDDMMETLHFLNTIDSQANVTIPHLKLPSDTRFVGFMFLIILN